MPHDKSTRVWWHVRNIRVRGVFVHATRVDYCSDTPRQVCEVILAPFEQRNTWVIATENTAMDTFELNNVFYIKDKR